MYTSPVIDISIYDTDKPAIYFDRYAHEFGHLFSSEIALLELGVQRGGSMYLWRDLFPNGQIAGLDLNPIPIDDPSGRIHVYQGFQQDTSILDSLAAEVAPAGFDIVIDDASHLGEYSRSSFWHLFRHHLKPGGIYVLEDWGCAYWDEWPDGHRYAGARESIGDFRSQQTADEDASPGFREHVRRALRQAARPVASKLPPTLRPPLERLYNRVDGATIRRRFASHDYGMVGFLKQLIDGVAINDIDRGKNTIDNAIASIHVYGSQAFVHKSVLNA